MNPRMECYKLTTAILAYYRFQRSNHFYYMATECMDCDILLCNDKVLIEFEVKVSWADYAREFKKLKYQVYYALPGTMSPPHLKSFVAPPDLAQKIAADLRKKESKFGCITFEGTNTRPKVIKRASYLIPSFEPVPENVRRRIIMRMSSDVITLRRSHYRTKNRKETQNEYV